MGRSCNGRTRFGGPQFVGLGRCSQGSVRPLTSPMRLADRRRLLWPQYLKSTERVSDRTNKFLGTVLLNVPCTANPPFSSGSQSSSFCLAPDLTT